MKYDKSFIQELFSVFCGSGIMLTMTERKLGSIDNYKVQNHQKIFSFQSFYMLLMDIIYYWGNDFGIL